MIKTIVIKIYDQDTGYGRVVTHYDTGNPSENIQNHAGPTLADALIWIDNAIPPERTMNIKNEIISVNRQTEEIRKLADEITGG